MMSPLPPSSCGCRGVMVMLSGFKGLVSRGPAFESRLKKVEFLILTFIVLRMFKMIVRLNNCDT